MRVSGLLVLAAGCTQVFGIEKTDPKPPEFFDAPIDVPFTCPGQGATLEFSRLLNQIPQRCNEYALSTTGRATAMCSEPKIQIAEGPVDGLLAPVAGFEQSAEDKFDLVRYTPEGDELFIRHWQQSTVVGEIIVARADASGFTKHHVITLPGNEPIDSFVRFGSPSRGPMRRMFIHNGTENGFREIEVDAAGTSTLVATYKPDDLGFTTAGLPPNLSSDGLRVVINASDGVTQIGVWYMDRGSLGERFTNPRPVMNVPSAPTPSLTEDCGRLYFTGFNYIFWVKRV